MAAARGGVAPLHPTIWPGRIVELGVSDFLGAWVGRVLRYFAVNATPLYRVI